MRHWIHQRVPRWWWTLAAGSAALLCIAAPIARAEDPPAAPAAPAAEAAPSASAEDAEESLIEPAAVAPVKRMIETLEGAKSMRYEYENSYDVLQEDGEILEFGGRGSAAIRRPDRVRGETWNRTGRHLEYAWDGKNLVVFDETHDAYATTPRTGDLDSLVDFLRDDIGIKLPLADLFTMDLDSLLIANTIEARWVGKDDLRGVPCDHVALRLRSGVDIQYWIPAEGLAVPQRIVLNFSTADGRPQFRSDFDAWEIDPWLRDSQFTLKIPKGAKLVPFMKPHRDAQAAVEEGAR